MAKFNSVKEVERYLEEVRQQLRDDFALADKNIKQLASVSVKSSSFKILDISGNGKKKKLTIGVDFPIVSVPKLEKLKDSYALTEQLTEQYQELEVQENSVRMAFRDSSAAKTLLGEFAKLKSSIKGKLQTLFAELSKVAEGHAPEQYQNFVKMLADELNENQHIECDSINSFTYASVDKEGKLVFAGYIVMNRAISDDGNEIPHLYIVVKWTVGESVEVYVEHEFIQPGMLTGGDTVGNVHEAAKIITEQLTLEGFSSQIGNLPADMQLRAPGGLNKEAFTVAQHIEKIETYQDVLSFLVKPESAKLIDDIKMQLYLEVKKMLKKKRGTTVKMRQSGRELIFTFSNLDTSGGIHPVDLDWLEEKYKLNQTQLRKIANEINNG